MNQLQPGQLIRITKLKEITDLPKSTIYRLISENRFPKQIKLGKRAVAWRTSDIVKWMSGLSEVN
jgi:predicted DNA-binding transcriptional regulator AlpA